MAGPFVSFEIRSHAGGAAPAKLNTTMAVDALSFVLQAGQGASYPDGSGGPFHMSLDFAAVGMEHVRVSSRSGDTFNLNSLADRGLMGTTALQHAQGASVSHGWSALESDEVVAAAHNTLGKISNKGDMLYADSPTTMAALAKGTAGQSPVYQADSSVAAGNPIPASHTHPVTDIIGIYLGLLATNQSPAWPGNTAFSASATPAAVSLTTATVTFTAPPSGKVLLRFSGLLGTGSDGFYSQIWWQNRSGGGTVGIVQRIGANFMPTVGEVAYSNPSMSQVVSGLTPATSYTLDVWGSVNGGTQGYFLNDWAVEAWAA